MQRHGPAGSLYRTSPDPCPYALCYFFLYQIHNKSMHMTFYVPRILTHAIANHTSDSHGASKVFEGKREARNNNAKYGICQDTFLRFVYEP